MNIIPTVGVLILESDRVLLVKHGDGASHLTGVYGWPGGRINDGETPIQAAIRELEEETGLVTTEAGLVPFGHELEPVSIQRKNGVGMFSAELFVCVSYAGRLRSTDETTPEWVDLEQIDRLKLLPNVKFVIDTIIKERTIHEA